MAGYPPCDLVPPTAKVPPVGAPLAANVPPLGLVPPEDGLPPPIVPPAAAPPPPIAPPLALAPPVVFPPFAVVPPLFVPPLWVPPVPEWSTPACPAAVPGEPSVDVELEHAVRAKQLAIIAVVLVVTKTLPSQMTRSSRAHRQGPPR